MSHATAPYKVVKVKSFLKGPYCSPWRHPIWWWKMRHLRRDIEVMEEAVDSEFRRKCNEEIENKMIEGTGD